MKRHPSLLLAPLVALALAAGSFVSTAPAGAAEVGINVAATSGDYFTSPKVRAAIRASRPAWVRVFIGWDGIEPQQGVYNTAEIQNYQKFFAALPAGTKIDVDVEGSPPWAADGSNNPATAPANDANYAGFVNYLVNAFHGRVTAWEIWNEEDNSGWWNGTPGGYAALLKAAYPAIKSADPKATVLVGGLTGNDGAYLSQLYADGAKGSFDAVGVHTDTACNIASPYSFEYNLGTHTVNQYFFLGFTSIHAVMVNAGRRRQAGLHDRARLVLDQRRVPDRPLGRPEARRRDPADAGRLPAPGLPLSRAAGVLLRQGGDVVRAVQQRRHQRAA